MGLFDRIREALSPAPVYVETVADAIPPDDPNSIPSGGDQYQGHGPGVFVNQVQEIGTPGDARFWDTWRRPRVLREHQREAMARDLLIQRALKIKALDAAGTGWKADVDTSKLEPGPVEIDADEIADALQDYEDRTQIALPAKIADAMYRGDLHKFAIVLLGIKDGAEDGSKFEEPVGLDSIQTISWARVFDGRDVEIKSIQGIDEDGFGTPESYIIRNIEGVLPDGWRNDKYRTDKTVLQTPLEWPVDERGRPIAEIEVHASRCLLFHPADGIPIPDKIQWHLANYFRVQSGIARGADEFAQTVIAIKDWLHKARNRDASASLARVKAMQVTKSFINAIIVDKDNEEYTRVSGAVSGLEKMVNPSLVDIAAAIGVPVTVFWGVSPGGFGTGQSEIQNYERGLGNTRKQILAPQIRVFHTYALVADDFTGPRVDIKPESREIVFNDLTPPTEAETNTILKDRVAMIVSLMALQPPVLDRDEARATLESMGTADFEFKLVIVKPPLTLPGEPGDGEPGELEPVDGELPGDTEDAPAPAPEPEDELAQAFSTKPLPNDAGTPKDIATELTVRLGRKIPTGRVTSLAKRGVIQAWNILGGADLHSLKEVLTVIAQQNGLMPDQIEAVEDEDMCFDAFGYTFDTRFTGGLTKLFAPYSMTHKTRAAALAAGLKFEETP